MSRLAQVVGAVIAVTASLVAATNLIELQGVSFDLIAVSDSSSYLKYDYELSNPSTSDWAIGSVKLSIAASSGAPANLAVTGALFDVTALGGGPVAPHAEVGPISPQGWEAILDRNAGLRWSPPNSRAETVDSVAPGMSQSGFGIRSSYLPGMTIAVAEPTITSCCLAPADTTEEPYYPLAGDFAVSTTAVVPRYMPSEVDLTLLESQLSAVCTDPLWLDDSELCTEFDDLLDLAAADQEDDNLFGAAAVLGRLLDRVGEEEGGAMHRNAYLLLSLNVEQAQANLEASADAVSDLYHFRAGVNNEIITGAHTLGSPQWSGDIEAWVQPATEDTLYFIYPIGPAAALDDGKWSLQLEMFEMTAADSELILKDVKLQRYGDDGTLRETHFLHEGDLTSLPAGESRISLTSSVTGWSAGEQDDWLVLSFTLENEHQTGDERYGIRAGTNPTHSVWGSSWLTRPIS